MSEIVKTLLEKYREQLTEEGSISEELISAVEIELSKDQPNAESLADLIKKTKKSES